MKGVIYASLGCKISFSKRKDGIVTIENEMPLWDTARKEYSYIPLKFKIPRKYFPDILFPPFKLLTSCTFRPIIVRGNYRECFV